MTLRDDVWNAVLDQLVKSAKFRISDLQFPDGKRSTVRRVLRQMEELGWLRRDSKLAATWRAGEKAELLLNISDTKLRQARE